MSKTIDEYANEFYENYSNSDFQINQGASVLLIKDDEIYFALAKEKSWKYNNDKIPIIKFTGIGGTREKDEKIFKTLKRELKEEVNLNIENLNFPKITETTIVTNYSENSKIKFNGLYNPLYIVDYRLPLRDDIKINEKKKYSCLQLFVYIANVDENISISPVEEDNITGIISANKENLVKYLNGNCQINSKEANIKWKKKYKNLEKIIINPKFTPKGIIDAGLDMQDLLDILKGEKYKYVK